MPSFSKTALLAALALHCVSCHETARSQAPPKPISTPIPEKGSTHNRAEPALSKEELSTPESAPLERMLKRPLVIRFSTPGSVRWKISLQKPITFIRWTPLAGLVVSAGTNVHNITSRGVDRWRFVAGDDHKMFVVDDQEVVWSPSFGYLSQIRVRGRRGWKRNWTADLKDDGRGGFLLVDAATVSAIGPDGKDRWRSAIEGLRRLEGPFPCTEGNLFHGMRGMEGVAVNISNRGVVVRETTLERGAIVLGAGSNCTPLVWNGSEIGLLDNRGLYVWHKSMPTEPMVKRIDGGFILASDGIERPVLLESVRDNGKVVWSSDLPVSGRMTGFEVLSKQDDSRHVIGLCMDVSSPCSRPSGTRGPFNMLITAVSKHDFHALARHVKGHLDFAAYDDGGMVVASSSDEHHTDLTTRDSSENVLWSVSLPGRLSAGPYVGPDGEIYIATCAGWDCQPPYYLFAVTGRTPKSEGHERDVKQEAL